MSSAFYNPCILPYKNFTMLICFMHVHIPVGSTHGVMVIIVGNGHNVLSSNPGQDSLSFT